MTIYGTDYAFPRPLYSVSIFRDFPQRSANTHN